MKSMTGYGKGVCEHSDKTVTIELKAVNNRFLEINSRLPKYLLSGEEAIRKVIGASVKRGTVEVYYDIKCTGSDKKLEVDDDLLDRYIEVIKALSSKTGADAGMRAIELIKLSDVVSVTSETNVEEIAEMIKEACEKAACALDEMRLKEGETIMRDLGELVGNIDKNLAEVIERAPVVVTEYREKLKKRLSDYLGEIEPDEAKLLNEVAFFADKADINEEIKRLLSHIAQFEEALCDSREVGRKLDFISQEMNREINTMGSKSNDIEITKRVVAMKNELEKIKEQIRNVE